jgi:hypothetical protein
MAFAFPEFSEPTAIAGKRSWTATFDSYDQRNDDAYYLVTVRDDGLEEARFMAQIGMYWAGDDWTTAGFPERLHREVHRVAATGVTNTSYAGSMTSRR